MGLPSISFVVVLLYSRLLVSSVLVCKLKRGFVRRNYHLGRGTSSRSVVVDVLDGPRFGETRGGVCPNVWIPAEYGTSFIACVWQGGLLLALGAFTLISYASRQKTHHSSLMSCPEQSARRRGRVQVRSIKSEPWSWAVRLHRSHSSGHND